jgi:hypothetical protein
VSEHLFSNRAEHELPHPRSPVSCHYNQIDSPLIDKAAHNLPHGSSVDAAFMAKHFDCWRFAETVKFPESAIVFVLHFGVRHSERTH